MESYLRKKPRTLSVPTSQTKLLPRSAYCSLFSSTMIQTCPCGNVASSAAKNNKGIEYIYSGDFSAAVQCFHEALQSHRSVLTRHRNQKACCCGSTSAATTMVCSPLVQKSKFKDRLTQFQFEDNPLTQVYLDPIYVEVHNLHGSSQIHQDVSNSLTIATIILNTAIAYHLSAFSKGVETRNESELLQKQRLQKAKSLYTKILQILMAVDSHLDELTFVQDATYDLVVMASLNNLLSLTDASSEDSFSHYAQYLLNYALGCNTKDYGDSFIAQSINRWKHEFLATAIMVKWHNPTSAPAA